jgi:hypothetical protein
LDCVEEDGVCEAGVLGAVGGCGDALLEEGPGQAGITVSLLSGYRRPGTNSQARVDAAYTDG